MFTRCHCARPWVQGDRTLTTVLSSTRAKQPVFNPLVLLLFLCSTTKVVVLFDRETFKICRSTYAVRAQIRTQKRVHTCTLISGLFLTSRNAVGSLSTAGFAVSTVIVSFPAACSFSAGCCFAPPGCSFSVAGRAVSAGGCAVGSLLTCCLNSPCAISWSRS